MGSHLFCIFILAFFAAISIGCKENPNPELLDPIYMDLMKEADAYGKAAEEAQKKVETKTKDLAKTKPRTIERKNIQGEILSEQTKRERSLQMQEYYKIRAIRRKAEGQIEYKKAFKKKEPWPKPEEYEAYKLNKALVSASKNWGDRVPKAPAGHEGVKDAVEEAAKAGGEAGGH